MKYQVCIRKLTDAKGCWKIGSLNKILKKRRLWKFSVKKRERERKISIWHLWRIYSPERNSFYREKNLFGTDVCPLMTFARFILFEANFSRGNSQIYPQIERQNLLLLVWKAPSFEMPFGIRNCIEIRNLRTYRMILRNWLSLYMYI